VSARTSFDDAEGLEIDEVGLEIGMMGSDVDCWTAELSKGVRDFPLPPLLLLPVLLPLSSSMTFISSSPPSLHSTPSLRKEESSLGRPQTGPWIGTIHLTRCWPGRTELRRRSGWGEGERGERKDVRVEKDGKEGCGKGKGYILKAGKERRVGAREDIGGKRCSAGW
jgi:hypothetical protein